jgi:hypothetical protein
VTAEGRKALAFFAGFAVLGVVAAGLATRLLGIAAGPEAEIIAALKRTEGAGATLRLEVPGTPEPLVSTRHFYERIVVDVEPDGTRARTTATLDFDGRIGLTEVSSLGLERIPWRRADDGWTAPQGYAPLLVRVVGTLERRRQALQRGDAVALARLAGFAEGRLLRDAEIQRVLAVTGREYRAVAWYIRAERGEVLVTEEFRLLGHTRDRPVDETGTRRLVLHERGGEFLFSAGLM